MSLREQFLFKDSAVLSRLNPQANLREPRLAILRIVNKAVLLDRRSDSLFELVLANELLVVTKRDCETGGNRESRQPRAHQLAQVGGFRAETNRIARALVVEIGQPVV